MSNCAALQSSVVKNLHLLEILNLTARQNKPIKFMTNDYPFFGKAWKWKDDSDPICSCAVFHKYMKRGAQGCV